MRSPGYRLRFGLAAVCGLFACKSHEQRSASASADAPPSSMQNSAPASSSVQRSAPVSRPPSPVGPVLAIAAGKGVGPIRLGATVATIERLMDAPCEVQTADVCRYVVRAVEFDLKDGVTDRIVVHRHDRPAGTNAAGQTEVYGFFNGAIPPGVGLGMTPSAVLEALGKPTSTEAVTTANVNNTIERATYPGLVLEYDVYKNGKVMLGGIVIGK